MLKMLHADFPTPFQAGLEYNSPAHGTWNIVHTGMLVPGAHQIYVCTPNCARGVILTAAEMNAMDRMSSISLVEEDFINGDMENLIIDGVGEILSNLRYKPEVILLFTVCVHHFMGTDLEYIYEELGRRYPEYRFVDCYMDPIMQKAGLTPDQKLRIGMYQCLEWTEEKDDCCNIIGSDLPLLKDSEIILTMKEQGREIRDITQCETYEEYAAMAKSKWNMVNYPNARAGGEILSERLQQKYIYFPQIYHYGKMREMEEGLYEILGIPGLSQESYEQLIEQCEAAAKHLGHVLGNTAVAVDHTVTPYYLSLTRYLLDHDIQVKRIYGDGFMPEEKEDYLWIQQHHPEVELFPTIDVRMRRIDRQTQEPYLAIGQKAAYFSETKHFVNMVEGGGLLGFAGIVEMMHRIEEAFREEKDPKDYISRKGLGCVSCL